MDQFKLVLWALFFTLLIPLFLWTTLFAVFGWKLFLVLFAVFGLIFFFRDKIFKSPAFQSVIQMLIPFALTFRLYDALSAGKEKSEDKGNIFQILFATSKGFLNGGEETEKMVESNSKKGKNEQKKAAQREAEGTWSDKRTSSVKESTAEQEDVPKVQAKRAAPSGEQLDDMLAALKQKMSDDTKD